MRSARFTECYVVLWEATKRRINEPSAPKIAKITNTKFLVVRGKNTNTVVESSVK